MKTTPSLFLLGFIAFLVCTQSLHAIPAFAKQTGLECFMCHAGKQSALNSFGRNFARSAYTMAKEDSAGSLLSAKELGLDFPSVLNMSLMLKARADFGNDVVNGKGLVVETQNDEDLAANNGLHEIFKTSTLNLAGKISNNVGTLLELREKEGAVIFGGKVISSFEVGDTSRAGVTVYTTNNYGPFSGMETYTTGLYKALRQFENHKLTNAAQATDLGSGQATGIQAFYNNNFMFFTLGAYVPIHNSTSINVGRSMIPFARIAFERQLGDLNLIIGAYGLDGTAKADNTDFSDAIEDLVPSVAIELQRKAYGVDVQLEGEMFSYDSLLTINVVLKNETTLDNPAAMNYTPGGSPSLNVFGEPIDADSDAFSISYEIYPTSALGLKLAYLDLNDKGPHTYEVDKIDAKDKIAYSAGLDYSIRQNVTFSLEYSYVEAQRTDIGNYSDLLSVLTVSF